MTDQGWDRVKDQIGEAYNVPPEAPRDAMWAHIEGQIGSSQTRSARSDDSFADVTPLRNRFARHWRLGTVVAAAASAVLWVGFGLGRATHPALVDSDPIPTLAEAAPSQVNPIVRVAATRHLAATQSLLTTVGSEAAMGALDPNVAAWASRLLTDTRLMLDSSIAGQGDIRALLEDLELILVQVVHASNAGAGADADVGKMELQQLTQGMQDNDVLPRIQELLPPVMAGAADE